MLGKLKTYGLAILGFLLAIVYALFRSEQAKRAKEKLERAQQARKIEQQATETMVDGLKREDEKVEETKRNARSGRRDHFEP